MLDKQARADVDKAYKLIQTLVEAEMKALGGYEERAQLIEYFEELLGSAKDENEAAFVEECENDAFEARREAGTLGQYARQWLTD